MNVEFWDQRYAASDFAYGTKPNEFVRTQLTKQRPGKILFPAEGEGRNAVFAAQLGYEVFAFDPSEEGYKKASKLASEKGVKINYQKLTYDTVEFPLEYFDFIVLVFAHIPPSKRQFYHQKLLKYLKPKAKLFLQGFSKEQISRNTGGPKDISMLFSEDELKQDFGEMTELKIWKEDVILKEGLYHDGLASVINCIGIK